jgi:hypothetical protein
MCPARRSSHKRPTKRAWTLAKVGKRADLPEPPHLARARDRRRQRLSGKPLERRQVDGLGRGAEHGVRGRPLEIGDERRQAVEPGLRLAPVKVRQRGKAMLLDGVDFLLAEFGAAPPFRASPGERAEGSVALMAPGAARDLRHLRGGEPALADAVELGEPGEGDVVHVEVEAHADGIGRDDVIDLACLEQRDLLVARLRAERPHDDGRPAPEPAQHLGDRIDLLGAEGDDGAARRQARQLARADVLERGKARPGDDFGTGCQRLHQGLERGRAKQHGLFAPAQVEQAVGENVPALAVGSELRFVERDERAIPAALRHGLHGAAQVARARRLDPLLPGHERNRLVALYRADPVIDLARKKSQRKAHGAARMRDHALDREMRLAGIGGSEDRLDRTIHRVRRWRRRSRAATSPT